MDNFHMNRYYLRLFRFQWSETGGVLSAILFTIYINKLHCELNNSGLGCRMMDSYVEALLYADDITLLCSSIRSLSKMLDICDSFSDEYNI